MPHLSPAESDPTGASLLKVTAKPLAAPGTVPTVTGSAHARWPKAWENLAVDRGGSGDACPVCGELGEGVGLVTLRALIRKDLKALPDGEGFQYCRTLRCPIVWYRGAPAFAADAAAVRVPVNVKMEEPSRPLCYCLKVDEAAVLEEVVERGCCTTLEEVQEATRANTGKACHVTNPSGGCCERDVLGSLAKGLASAGRQGEVANFQALEGCCVRPAGPASTGRSD